MNFWEKLILSIVGQVVTELPVLIHSKHGAIVLNASEAMLAEAQTLVPKTGKPPA